MRRTTIRFSFVVRKYTPSSSLPNRGRVLPFWWAGDLVACPAERLHAVAVGVQPTRPSVARFLHRQRERLCTVLTLSPLGRAMLENMYSRKALIGVLLACATCANAQWLDHPDSRTPRTRDGKPNLSAPAPRAAVSGFATRYAGVP